jgi:hypothetical protein
MILISSISASASIVIYVMVEHRRILSSRTSKVFVSPARMCTCTVRYKLMSPSQSRNSEVEFQ